MFGDRRFCEKFGYHPRAIEHQNTDWRTLTKNISVSFLNLIDWLQKEEIKKRPNNIKVILDCLNKLKDGEDLETWMQRNNHEPIDEQLAIDWLIKLANILKLKHDNNLIHRNIHPSNIILNNKGTLELLNFGTEIDADSANNDNYFTGDGYTPDEQRQGNPVFQSDFYALGHTFVYLLTGHHPRAIEDQNTDWKTQTNNISDSFLNLIDWLKEEEIKKGLIDWLMKRNMRKRPGNANQILIKIQKIQSNRQIQDSRNRKGNNNLGPRLGCLSLLLITGILAGIWAIYINPPLTECKVKDGLPNKYGISKQIENKIKSKLGQSLLSLTILQKEFKKGKCDIYLYGEILNKAQLDSLLEEIQRISVYINLIYTGIKIDQETKKVEFCLPNNNDETLPWDYLAKKLEEEYNKDNQLKERYTFRLPTDEEIEAYLNKSKLSSQQEITTEQGSNIQQEIIIFHKGCEIILRGQVETESDKTDLIDIANNLEGVKLVNEIDLKVISSENN